MLFRVTVRKKGDFHRGTGLGFDFTTTTTTTTITTNTTNNMANVNDHVNGWC